LCQCNRIEIFAGMNLSLLNGNFLQNHAVHVTYRAKASFADDFEKVKVGKWDRTGMSIQLARELTVWTVWPTASIIGLWLRRTQLGWHHWLTYVSVILTPTSTSICNTSNHYSTITIFIILIMIIVIITHFYHTGQIQSYKLLLSINYKLVTPIIPCSLNSSLHWNKTNNL